MKIYFDHERLDAYKKALAFAAWTEDILERVPKSAAVHGQLDRARASIVLNIPEGNGRFTPADRCKFFDIARGSALESAGCVDLIFIKKLLSEVELDAGKSILKDIVSLLVGLIRSNSPDRLHEDEVEYRVRGED
jgi:four helix bundle protein